MLAQASRKANEHRQVTAKCDLLISSIESDPQFHDVNNEQNLGELKRLKAKLQRDMHPFDHLFLLTDIKKLKRQTGDGEWLIRLKDFIKLDISTLSDMAEKVLRRHNC